jgi:hypothetical protein
MDTGHLVKESGGHRRTSNTDEVELEPASYQPRVPFTMRTTDSITGTSCTFSLSRKRCTCAAMPAPVSFVHAPSLADFITTMVGFKVFGTDRC